MTARGRAGAPYEALGAYHTDPDLARAVVATLALRRGDVVLEPSGGGGAFVEALIERSDREQLELEILVMDVDPEAPVHLVPSPRFRRSVQSFLDKRRTWLSKLTGERHLVHAGDPWPSDWPRPRWIVGNPPFGVKLPDDVCRASIPVVEDHVRRALELTTEHVVYVLNAHYLGSSGRVRGIHRAWPPRSVRVLDPRPSFTGTGTDSALYVLCWWDKTWTPPPPDAPHRAAFGWLTWRDDKLRPQLQTEE